MRYVYLIFFLFVFAAISILGFRGSKTTKPPLEVFSDMDRMPKYMPQGESSFFSDGRTDRLPVDGTVARGTFHEDEYLATGKVGGDFGSGFPLPVTNELMERGQERYDIYCTVCHGAAGDGNSMTKKYGMLAVADLTTQRIADYTEGNIYDVIANGRNTMLPYADKLSVEDRWAVVLYVRALQRAATGSVEDLTPSQKEELGL
ncbi:cytochrome c [Puniceicoccaceae bacterium K14]|nr:cytochrome c [Puniceicoccaceae bacterium K14]